ncbi:hypothetical protein [Gordonia oryzae]|uniref:hypothetical protein n=1 Tax=Gordonia oryzae TaxID=2487349 RepID=UPI001FE856D5|nr:hypothetical protein [Gordonia oryzae]
MAIAISFLDAPLKSRAVGMTNPLVLGIGRLVFCALNAVEAGAVMVLIVCAVAGEWVGQPAGVLAVVAVVVLALRPVGTRPAVNRRSDEVLAAGADGPSSHAHRA